MGMPKQPKECESILNWLFYFGLGKPLGQHSIECDAKRAEKDEQPMNKLKAIWLLRKSSHP
jgi:hypothetical protein